MLRPRADHRGELILTRRCRWRVGAEQIWLALKTGGVPTKLVGYPRENHGLMAPNYLARRMCDSIARYDRGLEKRDPIWICVMVVRA